MDGAVGRVRTPAVRFQTDLVLGWLGFCAAGFADFFEEGDEDFAFAVAELGEDGGKGFFALGSEGAEGLFAEFGEFDPNFAAVFLVAFGGDEVSLEEALDGAGHGAAGETDFGGDLVDCLGAFFVEAVEDGEVRGTESVGIEEGTLAGDEPRFGFGEKVASLEAGRFLTFHSGGGVKKELREKPSDESFWRSGKSCFWEEARTSPSCC